MDEEVQEIMDDYDADPEEAEEIRDFADDHGLPTDIAKTILDIL